MTTPNEAAEQLGTDIAQHASEFAPRRRRSDRNGSAPPIVDAAPPPPEEERVSVPTTLTPNAMRIAHQVDQYMRAAEEAETRERAATNALHKEQARVEQMQGVINTQASEITSLRTMLEQERNKSMRLFAAVRTMRAASDEIVRIEEEERDAG